MLQQRLPELTRQVLHVFEGPAFGCLGELQEATERLHRCGFVDRPNWEALRRGLRPRLPAAAVEPGEWQHGWQHYASSSLEHHFWETVVLAQSCAADQAHFAFGSLRKSCVVRMSNITRVRSETAHIPNCRVGTVAPPVDDHGGEVRMPTRPGCQRSAQSGMSPIRQTSFTGRAHGTHLGPRVSRSGATVRINTKLRDTNTSVPATDDTAIEVLASGLLNHGARLAVYITMSAVTVCVHAATVDGAAHRSPELLKATCVSLSWSEFETGGRWNPEAAREAPVALRFSSFLAWRKRWSRMLAISCCRAFCGSLISTCEDPMRGTDGAVRDLADLFSAC